MLASFCAKCTFVMDTSLSSLEMLQEPSIDTDKLSYEIFSILESKFLFGYDDPKIWKQQELKHLSPQHSLTPFFTNFLLKTYKADCDRGERQACHIHGSSSSSSRVSHIKVAAWSLRCNAWQCSNGGMHHQMKYQHGWLELVCVCDWRVSCKIGPDPVPKLMKELDQRPDQNTFDPVRPVRFWLFYQFVPIHGLLCSTLVLKGLLLFPYFLNDSFTLLFLQDKIIFYCFMFYIFCLLIFLTCQILLYDLPIIHLKTALSDSYIFVFFLIFNFFCIF